MATAIDEKNNPKSILNGAFDDEPIFILRSTDRLAVPLVNAWIGLADVLKNFKIVPKEKVDDAIRARDMMVSWQNANHERMKTPD